MATLSHEQRGDVYKLVDGIVETLHELEMLIGDYGDVQQILNEAHAAQEQINQIVQRLEEVSE